LATIVDYLVPCEEKATPCEIKQLDDLGDVLHLIAEATRKYKSENSSTVKK
jgi:hypothetical protein